MSGPSSILDSLLQIPTADNIKEDHLISLIDQERPQDEAPEEAERGDSEAPTAPPTPGPSPLVKKLTNNSIALRGSVKREFTRRKYAKYGQDRYDSSPPEEDPASQPQPGEEATPIQTNYLERSRAKAKTLLKRKRALGTNQNDSDTVIDILYENQRGMFFFGVPKYSSSSLLPADPQAWQNASFRSSPVDIRNAQPPDPSWEWAWKSWYVDMSRDVDEEGWEYSLQFVGKWSWHGNHPWFHSFVRRRRWLRMRRRRDVTHHVTREKAHELTAEYFTIHPRTLRASSEDWSQARSTEMARAQAKMEDDSDIEKMDVASIGFLVLVLKKSAVDREKLVAVRKFVDTGGDELYYLADRMEEIMGLFVYQSSRRQLLTDLLRRHDEAHHDHTHDDEESKKDHETAARQAENLENAIHVADEQVKRLEYWSDIKSMASDGSTLLQSPEGKWDASKWQGLSPTATRGEGGSGHPTEAFASKQAADEGAHELHAHPEHEDTKQADPGVVEEKQSSEDSSEDASRYTTAAGSASEISGKSGAKKKDKGKARVGLDGVDEEDENEDEQAAVPDAPPVARKESVQIVEPVPESEVVGEDPTATHSPSSQPRGEGS